MDKKIPSETRLVVIPGAGHFAAFIEAREKFAEEMKKIEDCIDCGVCLDRCPYQLQVPDLLRKNYADYQRVLAGEVEV